MYTKEKGLGFPGGLVVKNLSASTQDTGDTGSVTGSGRPPGGGHGSPLQYSCLGNPMDRGARWTTVRGVSKSRTRLSDWTCSLVKHGRGCTRIYIPEGEGHWGPSRGLASTWLMITCFSDQYSGPQLIFHDDRVYFLAIFNFCFTITVGRKPKPT